MDFPSVVSLFVRLCVHDNMRPDRLKNASERLERQSIYLLKWHKCRFL